MPQKPQSYRPPRLDAPLFRPPRRSAHRRGYDRRWQRQRRRVLREAIWCADPFGHHAALGRWVLAEHVDHIVPLEAGGSNEPFNLQALCAACHGRKTVLYDGGFGRAKQDVSACRVHRSIE